MPNLTTLPSPPQSLDHFVRAPFWRGLGFLLRRGMGEGAVEHFLRELPAIALVVISHLDANGDVFDQAAVCAVRFFEVLCTLPIGGERRGESVCLVLCWLRGFSVAHRREEEEEEDIIIVVIIIIEEEDTLISVGYF